MPLQVTVVFRLSARWRPLSCPGVAFEVPLWNSVPLCGDIIHTELRGGGGAKPQYTPSLFESVYFESSQRSPTSFPSSPPDDSYEKCLATMTWKSARLTLGPSLTLHFPPAHQRDVTHFYIRPLVSSAQFRLSSRRDMLHTWNSWDCGDQVACEATSMMGQMLDLIRSSPLTARRRAR